MTRHEEMSCLLSCQKRRICRIDPQGCRCPMRGNGVGLLIATSYSERLHDLLSHRKIYIRRVIYSLISVISLIRQILLIPKTLLSRSVQGTKDGLAHPVILLLDVYHMIRAALNFQNFKVTLKLCKELQSLMLIR